jgi:hypothetical protein
MICLIPPLCSHNFAYLNMSEKSDWPYKAHKAHNDREPCKLVIIYKKLTIRAENFPYRAIARPEITL